ncbi:hypothetical protein JCM3775_004804 [Rhodotorula graminis]|uniref:Uncharacterized protein n=1 Tax=Rhodotorula graminis (strain WP1) TaxID=578459 RepID=A0A194SBT6_RHOGW|nr:uncharacterized protein RHOBADRAFT_64605 [Rhodotorula graminis WP1]KPV76866.1 hypothetical protein RHOBADRAFT_64605 [Rhodotorula graminis WP1]
MDASLRLMIVFLALFLGAFIVYILLSTCLGPPLIRWARSLLAAHHAASQGSTWDGGAGGGYRSLRRRGAGMGGLDQGRGGVEGYEMASLGAEEDE